MTFIPLLARRSVSKLPRLRLRQSRRRLLARLPGAALAALLMAGGLFGGGLCVGGCSDDSGGRGSGRRH